jgi:hypothetical protein
MDLYTLTTTDKKQSCTYQLPRGIVPIYINIDESTCMFPFETGSETGNAYKIFDMKTSQTIKIIEADRPLCIWSYVDHKYIIFGDGTHMDNIFIFSTSEMKFVHNIVIPYRRVTLMNDILYVLSQDIDVIHKYTITGEKIGSIVLKKPPVYYHLSILSNEIIAFCLNETILYDLDGELICRIKHNVAAITQDHLWIKDKNNRGIYRIYKRVV